jgi:hypothetical protein
MLTKWTVERGDYLYKDKFSIIGSTGVLPVMA